MIRLGTWEYGFFFWPMDRPDLRMYLWFYEWNLFDAVIRGEHTPGSHIPQKIVGPESDHGTLLHGGLELKVETGEAGARFSLAVRNESDHDWPDVATIIPCFNPGSQESGLAPPTHAFFDEGHERTWFASAQGLQLLTGRAVHFNAALHPAVEARSRNGRFAFSEKWPTSPIDATAGLIVRESSDGRWVTGIAWEDFLSVQGHNPWRCMHLGIRVGPLASGEARDIRGRLYLMPGTKEPCYETFRQEFAQA
jgi:hypothetical protein